MRNILKNKDTTWAALFAQHSYCSSYHTKVVKPYIKTYVIPEIEKSEFSWPDLIDFYFTYHKWKNPKTSPIRYWGVAEITEVFKREKLSFDWIDCWGNNFLNFLSNHYCPDHRDNAQKIKLNLAGDDILKIANLSTNPTQPNREGINFFWKLSNTFYCYNRPQERLLPLIKKYNIDIFSKCARNYDLFDLALSSANDSLIEFYLDLGFKLDRPQEDRVQNFIFFNIDHSNTILECYKKITAHCDIFKLITFKKTNYETKMNIIDMWTSFLEGHNYKNSYNNLLLTFELMVSDHIPLNKNNIKKAQRSISLALEKLSPLATEEADHQLLETMRVYLEKMKLELELSKKSKKGLKKSVEKNKI